MGKKPERETMRNQKNRINFEKKLWRTALLFAALILLGGCTRKEELLLLEEESVFEEGSGESGEDVLFDGGVKTDEEGAFGETAFRQEKEAAGAQAESGLIYVHVCGAVERPGVYELEAGSRVYEAVRSAGGFAECAEQNYVNQAQVLDDGVKLVIPTIEEAAAAREAEALGTERKESGITVQAGIVGAEPSMGSDDKEPAGPGDGRININTASEAQLCEIPGIGATRAAAIAAYRDAHGGFKKPEDIMQVNGIKEGMFNKIKDSICVD